MSPLDLLSAVAAIALAILTAWGFDRLTAHRGLEPPAFAAAPWRRVAAVVLLAGVLWLAVFRPLTTPEVPPSSVSALGAPVLFALHAILLATLAGWFLLAYGSLAPALLARQLGYRTERPGEELMLGLGVGVAAWLGVLLAVFAVAAVVLWLGGEELVPREPPAVVLFMAGLPVSVRLLLAASAGLVEETFFRGFLQPRMGVPLSTLLFVLAHTTYQEPLTLVGVTLLSLVYAGLVRWRRSIWAAVLAHALFDAIQLLVVIPRLLDALPAR